MRIDDRNRQIRRLAASGLSQRAIAEMIGVSQSSVSRVLQGERHVDPVEGAVVAAVRAHLGALDLDPAANVLAATALALAAKVDGCSASDATAAAQALPRLAAELADQLERLSAAESSRPSPEVVALLKEVVR